MPEPIHPSDLLRTSENVLAPDVRFAPGSETQSTATVPVELDRRLKDLSQFTLSDNVPIRVRIHFETAKNLYAYSWFVYRFHMVAQQHALATLELALRIRFYPPDGITTERRATLLPLLKRAASEGLLSAPKFRVVQRAAGQRARARVSLEATFPMTKSCLQPRTTLQIGSSPGPSTFRNCGTRTLMECGACGQLFWAPSSKL
jgi:hypothetical protein